MERDHQISSSRVLPHYSETIGKEKIIDESISLFSITPTLDFFTFRKSKPDPVLLFTESKLCNSLDTFPVEIKLKIVSFLDVISLCRCCCLNWEWNRLCSEHQLWKKLYFQHWGDYYLESKMKKIKHSSKLIQFDGMSTSEYKNTVKNNNEKHSNRYILRKKVSKVRTKNEMNCSHSKNTIILTSTAAIGEQKLPFGKCEAETEEKINWKRLFQRLGARVRIIAYPFPVPPKQFSYLKLVLLGESHCGRKNLVEKLFHQIHKQRQKFDAQFSLERISDDSSRFLKSGSSSLYSSEKRCSTSFDATWMFWTSFGGKTVLIQIDDTSGVEEFTALRDQASFHYELVFCF